MAFLDPFGTDAREKGISDANAALQAAGDKYQASLGKINYDVTPGMVNKYMSPDVAYRQNAATQALATLYGNSGALRSSAAQKGIMNENANIAAQAWNDAFGRASGVLGNNNNIALQAAQGALNTQQGIAANKAAQAANEKGWLNNVTSVATPILGAIF